MFLNVARGFRNLDRLAKRKVVLELSPSAQPLLQGSQELNHDDRARGLRPVPRPQRGPTRETNEAQALRRLGFISELTT